MPPRLRLQPKQLRPISGSGAQYICWQCRHASSARVFTPAARVEQIEAAPLVARHPATQPPSWKNAEFRKTQLHRQYQSLLHASPLMLIFQHNNLKSTEWAAIRRELAVALRKVDEDLAKSGNTDYVGEATKLQVVQTGIFASALRIVEFWKPDYDTEEPAHSTDPRNASYKPVLTGLSKEAYFAANPKVLNLPREEFYEAKLRKNPKHGFEPLLSGPLALLTLPAVSPAHLAAAISILAPSAPDFPAPKRKTNPGYHEPAVQNGLQKMMLLGARIEGSAFDVEGIKWVGGIEGGLGGLRAQLVAMLQGVGASVTNTLQAASKSIYLTVEGRRGMLEEEQKGTSETKTGSS